MATSSSKTASMHSSSTAQAINRLEEALARLEGALAEKENGLTGTNDLKNSLENADKKIVELQDKNAIIASRLDGAIARMKSVLDERT